MYAAKLSVKLDGHSHESKTMINTGPIFSYKALSALKGVHHSCIVRTVKEGVLNDWVFVIRQNNKNMVGLTMRAERMLANALKGTQTHE